MKKKTLKAQNKELKESLRTAIAQLRRYQKVLSDAGIIIAYLPEDLIL